MDIQKVSMSCLARDRIRIMLRPLDSYARVLPRIPLRRDTAPLQYIPASNGLRRLHRPGRRTQPPVYVDARLGLARLPSCKRGLGDTGPAAYFRHGQPCLFCQIFHFGRGHDVGHVPTLCAILHACQEQSCIRTSEHVRARLHLWIRTRFR